MSALKVVRDGHVLRVTLAKPERRNAFDAALIAELADAFTDVGDARAVLLEGEGPAFCAGADVEWQRAAIELSYEENVEDALRLYRMLVAVDTCPAPVVARIQGTPDPAPCPRSRTSTPASRSTSAVVTLAPGARMRSRSTAFRSSRIFPGQS